MSFESASKKRSREIQILLFSTSKIILRKRQEQLTDNLLSIRLSNIELEINNLLKNKEKILFLKKDLLDNQLIIGDKIYVIS